MVKISIGNENIIYEGKKRTILNVAKRRTKIVNCFICGRTPGNGVKIVGSHTIKDETLRLLCEKEDSTVYSSSAFELSIKGSNHDFRSNKIEVGVSEADVFNLICNDCDNTRFFDYEQKINTNEPFDDTDMSQIALKSSLFTLSQLMDRQRLNESSFTKNILPVDPWLSMSDLNQIDTAFHLEEMENRALHNLFGVSDLAQEQYNIKHALSKTDSKNAYVKVFTKTLNHITPIAVQTSIPVDFLPCGKLFQDTTKERGRVGELHICVFPNKLGKTRILAFCSTKDLILAQRLRFSMEAYNDDYFLRYLQSLTMRLKPTGFFVSKKLEEKAIVSIQDEFFIKADIMHILGDPALKRKAFMDSFESVSLFESKYKL